MSLTIGTDTYISLANADAYLTANYLSTDAKLIAWNALSDADCEVLLRKATAVIDQQPLVGYKVLSTQTLAFPRLIWTDTRIYNDDLHPLIERDGWYEQTEVPDAVKYAQCEIAINNVSPSNRVKLQREGVKSFSLGRLSESYGSGSVNSLPYEARQYLQPYTAGGVAIC